MQQTKIGKNIDTTITFLERVEKILELCRGQYLSVAQISEKSNIPVASIYRICKIFAAMGWVETRSRLTNSQKREMTYKALKIIKWRCI